jgi:hypothetical protein
MRNLRLEIRNSVTYLNAYVFPISNFNFQTSSLPNTHILPLRWGLFGFPDAADPCQNRQYPENNNADGNNDFYKIENSPPIGHYPEDPDTQKTKPHNDIQHDFVSPLH